uniref:DDE Tnp4 domain-containing protein n=1 Tax=Trichogramma kaykai TaxID=54128 RepID=A0ABD2WA46_9HYME
MRQTFCRHKSDHLVKSTLVVAPDGYILDIQGPYFLDGRNNDATTLRHELENDENLNNWFRPGDIVVVDRGYRDVIDTLEGLGLVCEIPSTPASGQRQLTTEDANETRLITKTRWIVEARNGNLKSIFKLLNQIQQIHILPNIGDFFRIGGAIINRWVALSVQQVIDFPKLTIEFLKHLTAGVLQIELAPSYIQDTLQRNNEQKFQVEMLYDVDQIPDLGFLRARIWS